MAQTRVAGDVYVDGNVNARTLTIPAGTLTDAGVSASAGIGAEKLEHQRQVMYSQVHGSAATTARQPIYIVRGATAEILEFRAGVVVACIGAATITVDLLKNGTTILSAAIELDNTNTAFTEENAAGFTSDDLVADDVLEISCVATAGGGTLGQGLYVQAVIREAAD